MKHEKSICAGVFILALIMNTSVQKKIRQYQAEFKLTQSQLSIQLQKPSENFILKTTITNGKLPLSFSNIFDNVVDIFSFIKEATPYNTIDLKGQALLLRVKCLKIRELVIDLTKEQLSKEEMVKKKFSAIEKRTLVVENFINNDFKKQVQALFEESSKKTIKQFTDQIQKLNQKVTSLTEKTQQLESWKMSTLKTSVTLRKEQEGFHGGNGQNGKPVEQKMLQLKQPTPQKQQAEKQLQPKKSAEKVKLMDYLFDIDPMNRFLQNYDISNSTISKTQNNQEIVMVYASNPIPSKGRLSIKFRINNISEGFVWIGLINQSKKSEQFIGDEPGAISYCLNGTQVLIDGKKHQAKLGRSKDGSVISMQIEISSRKLRFYRNERENAFLKLTIPESMANQPLFPFVQMISNGDSVTFL